MFFLLFAPAIIGAVAGAGIGYRVRGGAAAMTVGAVSGALLGWGGMQAYGAWRKSQRGAYTPTISAPSTGPLPVARVS